jgi:hypothetical protein
MTRKDYVMIAEAIRDAKEGAKADPIKQTLLVADYIADGLATDNPKFDRDRFMRTCGFDVLGG